MQITANYGLKKPEGHEFVDVDDLNDNADIIDVQLKSLETNKVEKVTGKQLSTNDYTTVEKNKLAGIAAGAQVNAVTSVAGKKGAVTLTKADVGLASVADYGIATQAEAEAGTAANKYMTPQRTQQAVDKNLALLQTQITVDPLADKIVKRDYLGGVRAIAGFNTDSLVGIVYRGISSYTTGQILTSDVSLVNTGHTSYLINVVIGLSSTLTQTALYIAHPHGTGANMTPVVALPSGYTLILNTNQTVSLKNDSGANRTLSMSIVRLS